MNEERFWELIDRSRNASHALPRADAHAIELQIELQSLGPKEIIQFQRRFSRLLRKAYKASLWNAARIICDGTCSEDGFADFRRALVGQGRAVYYLALQDPESLADLPKRAVYADEALLYAGRRAYAAITGTRLPSVESGDGDLRTALADFEAVLRRYPRLAKRYGYGSKDSTRPRAREPKPAKGRPGGRSGK